MASTRWCNVDSLGRVRWTNRDTGKGHSFTPDPGDKNDLVAYLSFWEARVDRHCFVLTDPAKPWKNGFPDPNGAADGRTPFGTYAVDVWEQRLARRRVNERSFKIHMTELERTRIPMADGRSLYDLPLTELKSARKIVEAFEAALAGYTWKTRSGAIRSYAEHTIRQTIDFVTGVIRAAIDDNLLPANALGKYDAPTARRRQKVRALEYTDYLGLRRHEPQRETRLMFDLIAGTGCRLGELMGLDVEDIKVTHGQVVVHFVEQEYRDKTRRDLKNTRRKRDDRKDRKAPIAPGLGRELLAFIAETGRTGILFRSTQKPNRTPSHENIERRFKDAARRAIEAGDMPSWQANDSASLPTPHNLRHSYVSWALGAKISAETISIRTGHSTASLWKTYAESLSDSEAAMDEHLASVDPYATRTAAAGAVIYCFHCGLPAAA